MSALSLHDLHALSPYLILVLTALCILLLEAFSSPLAHRFSASLTFLALAIALYAAYFAPASENRLLTPWLRFDALGRVFNLLFLGIGVFSTLLSAAFFQRFKKVSRGEYFFLFLSALFGLLLIGAAADFLILFLGFETLSISLYVLCGYMKKWTMSHESAMKYFFTGAIAAAFLLYGIALIYGAVGTTHLPSLNGAYHALATSSDQALFLAGIAFVTIGLAFKAAIVPFHAWAPDVYDGSPNPVTAFMAVGTKTGAFVAFSTIFLESLLQFDRFWNEGMAVLAYLTLLYGNFVALRQRQLRRFFAYSGISHAGFLMIPLVASTSDALPALLFYVVVYALATFGSFAILAPLDHREEGVLLEDLRGLFQRAPLQATILALCLLTLGGIPPTAGFLAKFAIFKVGFEAGYYGLVTVGLLTTVLSAYYYLRIVGAMLSASTETSKQVPPLPTAAFVGLVSFGAILLFSWFPAPLLALFLG